MPKHGACWIFTNAKTGAAQYASVEGSTATGFGSYVSLPCVVAARLSRIPTVVHEQDAAPGLANRLSVRLGAHAPRPRCPTRRCREPGSSAIRSDPSSRISCARRASRRCSRSSAARSVPAR